MVIIRRNEDGSIIEEQTQSHPALATKQGMAAMSDMGRAVPPLFSEIATKIPIKINLFKSKVTIKSIAATSPINKIFPDNPSL